MNFQTLPQVLKSSKYLDIAFREAGKQAGRGSRKIKQLEHKKCQTRIRSAEKNLTGHLRAVVETYPRIEELPEFYKELMMLTIDVTELKKALSSVNWAQRKIRELTDNYIRSDKPDAWKAYYGRVSSILKRIDKHLKVIESARRVMKTYPDIKEEYTVCLIGFPNVGKSTVLSRITSAKPEIKPYAFTTKGLNIGYFEHYFHLVQIIDTPGTLDRLEKMNNIEKQAYLAIKHCANLLVFIYDSTYDHEKQMILKSKIDLMGKQVILYVTKTDLKQPKHIDKKDYINSPALLKETIGAILKEHVKGLPAKRTSDKIT